MMNIGRLALVVSLSISAAAVVACSSPAPLSPTEESNQTSGSGSAQGSSSSSSGASDNGSSSSAPQAAADGDGGAPSDDASAPSDPNGKDVPPADPTCVSQCEAGLRAKCSGDDDFCPDMCSELPPEEITCLIAAPTCEKSEWIACEGNSGGGSGGKGTK
jgi:hypothetical protein